MSLQPLRVLDIVAGTSVDGPGLRTSIYFAGCAHACPGCHNPESWDFSGGREVSVDQIMDVIVDNGFDVTFSGGDPMYQPLETLTELARRIHAEDMTLWCYTGFTLEELMSDGRYDAILGEIDTLVDGPFVNELRDTDLIFRGSSNQRIIDMRNYRS